MCFPAAVEMALHKAAAMKASDRVLVHAAAGGVGLAAIQVVQVGAPLSSPQLCTSFRALDGKQTSKLAKKVKPATASLDISHIHTALRCL